MKSIIHLKDLEIILGVVLAVLLISNGEVLFGLLLLLLIVLYVLYGHK